MENQKEIEDGIKRITEPIFNRVLKETIINHTLVGSSQSFSTYEPHNHRLYFDYKRTNPTDPQPTPKAGFIYKGLKNHGSETQYEHEATGSKITIKKSQAELRYKGRKWFLIDNAHPEEVDKIKELHTNEAVSIFKEFVAAYGGKTEFMLLKDRVYDNTVKDNSLTKKIPKNAWWEDEISKKVYMEENKIEMKTEQAAKNLIHNAGLQDFNPKIEARLKFMENKFVEHLDRLDKVLVPLTEQIKVHLEVENRTNELLKKVLEEKGQHGGLVGSSKSRPSPLFPSCSPPSSIRDLFPEGWFE
jgi:hypothetical protein